MTSSTRIYYHNRNLKSFGIKNSYKISKPKINVQNLRFSISHSPKRPNQASNFNPQNTNQRLLYLNKLHESRLQTQENINKTSSSLQEENIESQNIDIRINQFLLPFIRNINPISKHEIIQQRINKEHNITALSIQKNNLDINQPASEKTGWEISKQIQDLRTNCTKFIEDLVRVSINNPSLGEVHDNLVNRRQQLEQSITQKTIEFNHLVDEKIEINRQIESFSSGPSGSSLVDDYANPNLDQPSHMDPDD